MSIVLCNQCSGGEDDKSIGLVVPSLGNDGCGTSQKGKNQREKSGELEIGAGEAREPGSIRPAEGQGRAEAQNSGKVLCVGILCQAG